MTSFTEGDRSACLRLMIPASLIACFVTCFVVAEANPQEVGVALLTSLAAGIVVFVGFCMLITMLGRF